MTIFYFLIGAFLRRWYGGCLEAYKILRSRGVQTVCMLAVFMSIYLFDWSSWQNWLGAAIVSGWLQFQFWSRGHGACFDIGRGTPSEETIRRYNERWYHYPVDWLFDKAFKVPGSKYGFMYDFVYMGLRYTHGYSTAEFRLSIVPQIWPRNLSADWYLAVVFGCKTAFSGGKIRKYQNDSHFVSSDCRFFYVKNRALLGIC